MICHSEDVCETVVADKRDRVSFNVDVAALSEELDAFSDRPVQVDKEILSDEDGITDSGGELVIAVEIDAEGRSEITAVGEGRVGWCDSFDGESFARNGDFGVVRASESRGDLRLVVGCEEVEPVDVDVLTRIASANRNDEVDVTGFGIALSNHAFANILAPGESGDGIVPDRGALGGEDVFSEIIGKNVEQIGSEPEAHCVRTASQSPAICVRPDLTFASSFIERPAVSRWTSVRDQWCHDISEDDLDFNSDEILDRMSG